MISITVLHYKYSIHDSASAQYNNSSSLLLLIFLIHLLLSIVLQNFAFPHPISSTKFSSIFPFLECLSFSYLFFLRSISLLLIILHSKHNISPISYKIINYILFLFVFQFLNYNALKMFSSVS